MSQSIFSRRSLLQFPIVGGFLGWLAEEATAGDPRARKSSAADGPAGLPELQRQVAALQKRVGELGLFNPPVGTILAFAGQWPPKKPGNAGQPGAAYDELELGWMLCNGRRVTNNKEKEKHPELPYLPELFEVLVGTNWTTQIVHPGRKPESANRPRDEAALPDLRGLFLRGVAHEQSWDPESAKRQGGDQVGSFQEWSTAVPAKDDNIRKSLATTDDGMHDHTNQVTPDAARYTCFARRALKGESVTIGNGKVLDATENEMDLFHCSEHIPSGKHHHTVTGGDLETRPTNAAVEWIIRIRS